MPELSQRAADLLFHSWSMSLGIAVNLWIVALVLPFYNVQPGTSIRPMGYVVLIAGIAFMAFLLGCGATIRDTMRGRERAASIGFWLCLAPFPLFSILLHLMALVRGFSVAD